MNDEIGVTDAAALKRVSRNAIHQAIRTGRLPARVALPPTGAQGVWRIRREDLEAWEPATAEERGRRGARARFGERKAE